MRSSFYLSVAVAALILTPLVPARAGDVALEEVILTGGLSPIEAARLGRAATVVSGDEIRARGIGHLQDVLRGLPGVTLTGTGRENTVIRIRGGEGNHTLILLDGVPLHAAAAEYYMAGLETEGIERIEVLRGAQSVYYGSNASSGVINIITRKAEGTGWGGKLELGNGSNVESYIQTRTANGGVRLSFGDLRDHGFDGSGKGGEKDGIYRRSMRLNADWEPTETLSFTLQLRAANERLEYDSDNFSASSLDDLRIDSVGDENNRRERGLVLSAHYGSEAARVVQHLSYEHLRNKALYYGNSVWEDWRSEALKYRAEIGLDGAAATSDHRLIVMAEHSRERFQGAYQPLLTKRRHTALAAEYRGNLSEDWSIQAGLRHDLHSHYANFTSWNLASSWQIDENWRLHASAGRAQVVPTFFELYGIAHNFQGNSTLVPEENRSIDFGVEYRTGDGRGLYDVTLFSDRLVREIYTVGSTPYNRSAPSRRRGLEMAMSREITDHLDLRASYTWLDAEQQGEIALRRPKHQLALQAGWRSQDQRLRLGAELVAASGSYDSIWLFNGQTPASKLPGYGVVNLSARYSLNDQITLTGRLSNVTNKTYGDAWGYNGPPRTLWLGLNAAF